MAGLAPLLGAWGDDEIPNRTLAARIRPDTCAVTATYEALRWYARLPVGESCPRVALLMPGSTEAETTRAGARWPAVCWATDRAAIRPRSTCDC